MKLTNPELHSYSPEPLCEAHAHLYVALPIDETVSIFSNIMRHFNYSRMMLNALPCYDVTENCKAFYCKSKLDGAYVDVGLNHWYDGRDTADFYLGEIKKYHAIGCDGIKMLEGKVKLNRKLNTPRLDDKVYDKFYAYVEENAIPIIMHLGDPIDNWDISKMSQYAIDKGWYCGPEDPTLEELRSQVDGILKKFPKLHLTLAHFYFMGDELERAAKMFDTYENLCFDLTPGGEMYVSFTANPKEARAFFEKYSERLLYGTDTYNFAVDERGEEGVYGPRINEVRNFLEKSEDYYVYTPDEKPLHGMAFPKAIQDNIYRNNFVRIYGATPRPLDRERIAAECKLVCAERELDDLMTRNMKIITDFFG